jgi:phospholipase/lecithinase/hemolysin
VSVAQNAANNIESNIKTLAGEGGKYFLWFNLPPLGDTPAARSAGPLAMLAANQATAAFNAQMSADVTDLEHMLSNVVIITIDIHSAFEQIEGNPQAFGFANITDSAQGKNVDPNTYLFWDDLHPTTAADALIADLAAGEASRFVTATPEPASVALAFLGIFVLAAFGWARSLSSRRCLVRPRSNE